MLFKVAICELLYRKRVTKNSVVKVINHLLHKYLMTVLYLPEMPEMASESLPIPHDVISHILSESELRDDRHTEKKTS